MTETGNGGWLALEPYGLTNTGTSSINWSAAGQTIANTTTVALSENGWISARCAGATHVVIDVIGFHR